MTSFWRLGGNTKIMLALLLRLAYWNKDLGFFFMVRRSQGSLFAILDRYLGRTERKLCPLLYCAGASMTLFQPAQISRRGLRARLLAKAQLSLDFTSDSDTQSNLDAFRKPIYKHLFLS
jgi:hypothetical protein